MKDLFGNPVAEENDFWYTPDYIWRCINEFFVVPPFDPCPVEPQFDGLMVDWPNDVYINPPYSQELRRSFINKAMQQFTPGRRFLWLMNFANNQDLWMLHRLTSAICIPQQRIKFVPGSPKLGDGASPRYDNIFLLWGGRDALNRSSRK